jgi:hypothetical protein
MRGRGRYFGSPRVDDPRGYGTGATPPAYFARRGAFASVVDTAAILVWLEQPLLGDDA